MTLTEPDYTAACDHYAGYCTQCDNITSDSGVEPDAENYKCPVCGAMAVMGIEQALLVGKITIEGEGS